MENFITLVQSRQSCRHFDPKRKVEDEKIDLILEAGRFSPSARNRQPYQIYIAGGEKAKKIAAETQDPGINQFVTDAPVLLVISEDKGEAENRFCSIDIGILAAHIVLQAEEIGLSSCMIGYFREDNVRALCKTAQTIRLIIAIGYASDEDKKRVKKRKSTDDLIRSL